MDEKEAVYDGEVVSPLSPINGPAFAQSHRQDSNELHNHRLAELHGQGPGEQLREFQVDMELVTAKHMQDIGNKEVFYVPEARVVAELQDDDRKLSTQRSAGWKRHRLLLWLAVLLTVLLIGAATTLGLLLSKDDRSTTPSTPTDSNPVNNITTNGNPPASNPINSSSVNNTSPSSVSAKGVLKGSRLATLAPEHGDIIILFYQYHSGDIQCMSLSGDLVWQGAISLGISDVMMGTPLTATLTRDSAEPEWWLFYLDTSGIIQGTSSYGLNQKKNAIGDMRYQAPLATNLGFAAHFGVKWNSTAGQYLMGGVGELDGGLLLYAGGLDGRIQEYIFYQSNSSWGMGYKFPNSNAYGGATFTNDDGSGGALLFNNLGGQLDFEWQNYNPNSTDTLPAGGPIPFNSWQEGSISTDSIASNTSICIVNVYFFQDSSNLIRNSGLTGNDLPTLRWGDSYVVNSGNSTAALPNTAITCQHFWSRETDLHVFYQSNENNIIHGTLFSNVSAGSGNWTFEAVPAR